MRMTKEDIAQIQVVDWVKQCTDLPVWHTANQRQTSPQHGSMLKRMGVRPGVADLFFPRKQGLFSGLFLELKVGSNKPTPLQTAFLEEMTKEGYMAACVWGSEAAIEFIKTFYNIN